MAIGEVRAKLSLDNAQFNSGMQQSGQIASTTGKLTEKASAQARAAFEKEQVAADRLQAKLVDVARAKELAALKSDILARSTEEVGKAMESAGHATVSQMQAASASIRLVEGGMTNNVRAVERFISTLPGVGTALQNIFPLVGGLAFVGLIAKMGSEFYKFASSGSEAAKAITREFEEMNDATRKSGVELDITSDKLGNAIAKLEHRPENGLKLALDEDRKAAYELTGELDKASQKLDELMKKNSVGFLKQVAGLAIGRNVSMTTGSEGVVRGAFSDVRNADRQAMSAEDNAKPGADADRVRLANRTLQTGALDRAIQKINTELQAVYARQKSDTDKTDFSAQTSLLEGSLDQLKNQRHNLTTGYQISDQTGQKDRDEAAKQSAEQGARAMKQAAEQRYKAMEAELNQQRLLRERSSKEEYDFWDVRKNAFAVGSDQYNAIVAKQVSIAEQQARQVHEAITKFRGRPGAEGDEQARMVEEVNRSMESLQKSNARANGERMQDYSDSNRLAIVQAHNNAHEEEARIMDEAGRSITRYDAAQQMANAHAKEYAEVMVALQANLRNAQLTQGLTPSKENAKSVAEAQAAVIDAQSKRGIQMGSDNDAIYGRDTSGTVGAKDALDELARAARDSAGEMHNFTASTIADLNRTLVGVLTEPRHHERHFVRDQFKGLGRGVATNVAGAALTKGEGMILSGLGFGGAKKPTGAKGDPLSVVMEGIGSVAGSATSSVVGGVKSIASAGGGFFSSLVGMLPHFADGGAIDSGTMSLVGERGPELFMPKTSGSIIPNHKLGGMGDSHTYHVDARGSNDPAQTEAAVHRAMRQFAPQMMSGAVRAVKEDRLRRPSSSH